MRQNSAFRLLCTMLLSCAGAFPDSEIQEPSEYQVKAAFLYNFVKFVEWPGAIAEQKGPIVMCVIGKDPFGEALVSAVKGKRLNGRPIDLRKITGPSAAVSCHVLFISESETGRVSEIAKVVRAWSVLTVGESERFLERGGIVNFFMEGKRVRFQINVKAATGAGLKISSKLLHLAATVPVDKGRN